MGCDVDHSNPEVQAMTDRLGRVGTWTPPVSTGCAWTPSSTSPTWVLPIYLDALRAHCRPRDLPVVAEYWSADLPALEHFLRAVGDRMMLFDVPLHYRVPPRQAGRATRSTCARSSTAASWPPARTWP